MNFIRNVGKALKTTLVSSDDLDAPEYEVTRPDEGEGYEERHYASSMWVSTTEKSMKWKDGPQRASFFKLFNYIQGKNEKKEKIEMTVPVMTRVVPGPGPNCESTFTMSFFVPPSNQETTPKPDAKEVFLERWPAMDVYVRKFSGFPKDEDFLREAEELAKLLDGKELVQGYYFILGYNSPWQMFNRRNEVMFVKKVYPEHTECEQEQAEK